MAAPILGLLKVAFAVNQAKDLLSLYPPIAMKFQKWSMSTWPVNLPNINELVEMNYRGDIGFDDYVKYCAQNGINREFAFAFKNIAKLLLPANDYINLYRRGVIDKVTLEENLDKLHIKKTEQDYLLKASEVYPSASDIVRFAVREVYSPSIAQKFGQYEDLPEVFLKESAKVGLSEETAKRFWAAHWELPSANMGYEMFQRGIITQDELVMLLRSLDVMPFWRDKLIKLSYQPITRVDIRRMYNTGVINDEEVYQSYKNIGYSPEDAAKLRDFTTIDVREEKNAVTKSQIDKLYKKDLITASEYKEYYRQLGYSVDSTETMFSIIDFEKTEAKIDSLVKEYKARYKQGLVNLDTISNELNGFDLPASYVTSIINEIKLSVSEKAKLPTLSDLTNWLKLNIIDANIFAVRAKQLGYSNIDVEYYLTEIQLEVETSSIKYLSEKKYTDWAKAGIITIDRYIEVLKAIKLSQKDIDTAVYDVQKSLMKGK